MNQEKMELERLKYELEMEGQIKANKKQNYIQDSKAYYNEQFNRKKEIEDQRLNEKFAKNNTSFNIKDEERREEYKKKLLKMTENIEKNADVLMEFNNNKEGFRNKYGNKSLYEQLKSAGKIFNLINLFL